MAGTSPLASEVQWSVKVSAELCPRTVRSGANDRVVLEALKFEPALRRFLRRLTHDSSEVPDLLQETYSRLLRRCQAGPIDVKSIKAFAMRIARNVGIDWLRHIRSSIVEFVPEPDVYGLEDCSADVVGIVGGEEELEHLARIVGKLQPACRRVFTLRKVFGFSQAEVAQRLGISENTVEVQMTKAARFIGRSPASAECPRTASELRRPFGRRRVKSPET